jgi:hypothetical protein
VLATAPPPGTDDALNAAIAGALVGAAATAAVTLLIFTIDRAIRTIAAFREMRRREIAGYFTVVGAFAVAAMGPSGSWADEGAALITARSNMTLALGVRHRSVGVWLTGMEKVIIATADGPRATAQDRAERAEFIEARINDIFNALINLQQGRLFLADFTLPAGIMALVALDPNYLTQHPGRVDWAFRPQNQGRWRAFVARLTWARNRLRGWFGAWRRPSNFVEPPE